MQWVGLKETWEKAACKVELLYFCYYLYYHSVSSTYRGGGGERERILRWGTKKGYRARIPMAWRGFTSNNRLPSKCLNWVFAFKICQFGVIQFIMESLLSFNIKCTFGCLVLEYFPLTNKINHKSKSFCVNTTTMNDSTLQKPGCQPCSPIFWKHFTSSKE